MSELVRRSRASIPPALAALVFALLSLAILPYPGLQDDEVLFTAPLYLPEGTLFSVRIFRERIPLMLIGYLGAIKTWLYAVIFECFAPSRWSVRLPMVLAGVLTIWLTWIWTRRAAGPRAAAFAVALLSTDAAFIMTNTFDWGPVALQHVLLMGGLVAVQKWLENDSLRMLALGFFLWGLGLWDKALMIWPLVGLTVAALGVYPNEIRRRVRRLPLAIAAMSLVLGALPLAFYNIARRGETASANTKISVVEIPRKLQELQATLDGSGLLDFIAATTPGPIRQEPATIPERLSVWLETHLGSHHTNWILPALGLSLACLVTPLQTKRRLLVFILIAATVTWLQMASNVGTGGSAHHVILMWPFPCIFVGIALAGVADRAPRMISRAITGLVVVIACGNLLNTNEYLADLALNGALGGWSDASYRLAGAVYRYRSSPIGVVDWGYLNGLRMMYEGDLKMTVVSDFVRKPMMTEDDRGHVLEMVSSPDFVFIQHTDDNQLFSGVNGQLRSVAVGMGYEERVERVVHDNEGRPVFEIFRFVKTGR